MTHKSDKCEEEDRISRLTDALILRILSFLNARDAVKSGVLSKRFEYLWTKVACLNFQNSDIKSVNTSLYFHKLSNLKKISVTKCIHNDICHYRNCEIELGRLIRLLSLARTKGYSLELEEIYHLFPQHFYSNSSLKKLVLTNCIIETTRFANWESLQSLTLSDMTFSYYTIYNVLSGCPSLKLLEMFECSMYTKNVLTNNLTELDRNRYLRDLRNVDLGNIDWKLGLLDLSGDLEYSRCKVLKAASLKHCYLDFSIMQLHNEFHTMVILACFLGFLSNIEVVTIGREVLQVICLIELKGLSCPMSKTVKCLKICSAFSVHDIAGIMCLLRGLTCLEKLSIETCDYDEVYLSWLPREDEMCLKNKAYWTSEIDLKLKSVLIKNLEADEDLLDDENHQLILVKLLLKSAKCLEKMSVVAYGSEHHLLKLNNKLLRFPRSSLQAVVEIKDSN